MLKHMSEISTFTSRSAIESENQGPVGLEPLDSAVPAAADSAGVPLERLEAQICELAGHLTAATCRFLLLVGDFDARRGWASWDLPSCAAWLAWKCQIAPGTAREHVRVARALAALPVIRAAFAAGTMSYAKVRALTRIATPATDADLAQIAGPMTAGQLERFVRAHRQVSAADDQRARAARRFSWRWEEYGSLALSIRLSAGDGAVVLQALRAAADDLEHPHQPEAESATARTPVSGETASDPVGTPPGEEDVPTETPPSEQAEPAAGLADALVYIVGAFLAGKITTAGNADLYQVIVHVGPEALTVDPEPERQAEPETEPPAEPQPAGVPAGTCAGDVPGATRPVGSDRPAGHPAHPRRCHLEDGPALSPTTAQRLACVATVSWMLHDHHGNLLDVGRRHRTPPPALRSAVRERDRYRCQFPGCHSRRTDLHHIRHWAKGGKTRLSNMILLCEPHHVIVHELGYLITLAPGGGFAFTRPDGTPVPASPSLPASSGDLTTCHQAAIAEDTIIPNWNGDKLDLDYAIWVAFANARFAESQN
jgi:5-methylcytosine-specific restriction endonuclease McrA